MVSEAYPTNPREASGLDPEAVHILYDNDLISREEFCEACGELLEREGWTGYNAVKAAWEGIPIDCSDILDNHLLPGE